MITERPDSRYSAENLAEIDTATIARLSETAEKMAFFSSTVSGLNAEWEAAYEMAQDELMRRVRNRKA